MPIFTDTDTDPPSLKKILLFSPEINERKPHELTVKQIFHCQPPQITLWCLQPLKWWSGEVPLKTNVLGRWFKAKFRFELLIHWCTVVTCLWRLLLRLNDLSQKSNEWCLMYSGDKLPKITFMPKLFITKVTGVPLDTFMNSSNVLLKVTFLPKRFFT